MEKRIERQFCGNCGWFEFDREDSEREGACNLLLKMGYRDYERTFDRSGCPSWTSNLKGE